MNLSGILERIEQKLAERGLSASAASKLAGKADAIRSLQRAVRGPRQGTRSGISTSTIAALAPVLGTSVSWLMEGGDEVPKTVPLVGYVGAGAEAILFDHGQGPFDEVPAPEGSTTSTVAVEIRGESLGSFFDKWLVFYDDKRDPVTTDLVGHLCVCGLADGRVLVKKLARGGAKNRFTLLSQFESPIFDAAVLWAAKVRNMTPRQRET